MKISWIIGLVAFFFLACHPKDKVVDADLNKTINITELNLNAANKLAKLPLKCIQNPLPYKSGIVIASEKDLAMPQEHHPAFYGCFDWHSAVHGHWSLVYLMKEYPDLDSTAIIRRKLNENLTAQNIQIEMDYFKLNRYTKSFERTYGWAWLLKLSEELYTWDDPDAQRWYTILKPLNELISEKYQEYLPKLVYPIRVGEHTNSAFGLSFAHDYAKTIGDQKLKDMIEKRAKEFYFSDEDCPLSWEPSGYDFLSPCLQEMDIMRKILSEEDFTLWSTSFLPGLFDGSQKLKPGEIKDRTDGKLVHLDGLNYSRAWCLYPLRNNALAHHLANLHLNHSIQQIADGDYSGEHWLASFALYALKMQQSNHQ